MLDIVTLLPTSGSDAGSVAFTGPQNSVALSFPRRPISCLRLQFLILLCLKPVAFVGSGMVSESARAQQGSLTRERTRLGEVHLAIHQTTLAVLIVVLIIVHIGGHNPLARLDIEHDPLRDRLGDGVERDWILWTSLRKL